MHVREFDELGGMGSGGLAEESSPSSRPSSTVSGADSSSSGLASGGYVDPALAEIVEEITRRVQSGEDLDLDEYARSHPEWSAVLHSLLSPLLVLAQFRRTAISASSSVPSLAAVVLPATFGDFNVRREVGRGGMGIVYEAEQLSLGRRVALKVLSAAAALDAQSRRRFQIEAEAAACLNHENIVPVHAVGSHDEVPFYAMQFIEGASLAEVVAALKRLRDGEPPSTAGGPPDLAEALALDLLADRFCPGRAEVKRGPPWDIRTIDYVRAVVRLAAQAAEALDHAHEQGILHRDIKPANLLLDQAGKLWVTDFGLARIIGNDTLTATGSLAGTLRYMSPEQVLGKRALVDRRSDLYSLGATLYELLTLELALDGHERWEILARIDSEEPRPIRRLNPAVPRDLATIVAKAMAKDVSGRYVTAQDLGEDLDRFLDGRPVEARRVGAWGQIIRWSRRNPAVASLLIALVVVFFAGFAAVTVQWRRAESEADRANQTARAEAKARSAESSLRIQAQAQAAARDFDHALDLARRGDVDQGLLWMAEALRQAPAERPELGRMARANLASWTDQVAPPRAVLEHHSRLYQAVFRFDGRVVLTGSRDGTARVWDTSTGRPIGPPIKHVDQIVSVAFSPDGRLILTGGSDGKARLWDAATAQPAGPTLLHGAEIGYVLFSPDGRLFMTFGADHIVRLWDTATGRPAGQPVAHTGVANVDLSVDGRLLLTGGTDGVARLWDVPTGRPTGAIFRHDDGVTDARFSPDQRLVATIGEAGTTRLWNAATGQPVGSISNHHETPYSKLSFSPNGRLLLTTGGGNTARLWDTATGRPIGPIMRHAGEVLAAAFSPDGKLVVTGSFDHTARLWDTATGQPFGAPLRHRLSVRSVSFSPDGKLVLTASEDGTAKLWEVDTVEVVANAQMIDRRPDESHGGSSTPSPGVAFEMAAFSPDRGRVLLAGTIDGLARLVDTDAGQPVGPPMPHRWPRIRAIAFSPDGHHLATASHDRGFGDGGSTSSTCQIWDAATARPCAPLLPHINYVSALAFRPDGKVLATGDYSGSVHLWDVETGASLRPPLPAGSIVFGLAFSPDGRMLAAGTAEPVHHVVLWDLAAGRPRGEPLLFKRHITKLAFSPDGRRLAIASMDTTARLVDVSTGRAVGEPMLHAEAVHGLAFSPKGRLLLTVNFGQSGNSAARLWNVATGQPASPALAHPSIIASGALAFSPDGAAFATGCEDGSVHLWDVASATPVGPPWMLRGYVLQVAFRPDGRTLLAVDHRGNVGSWPVPVPSDEPVERLIQRGKARSGLELDAARELVVLDPETWRQQREGLDDRPRTFTPADDLAWHDARARDSEALRDGFAARWHLERMISDRPGEGLLRARLAHALLLDGELASARTELAHAIELGPRDRVLDWLVQRAEDFRASGRPDDALLLIDQVIAARPDDDWLVHARRAEVLAALGRTAEREAELARAIARGADIPFLIRRAAQRGRAALWRDAAELYDRAIARGTVPYEVWQQAAVAHLEIDDRAGYRRVCEAMRSRHPEKLLEPLVRLALAGVCTLGPGGVGDDGKARSWAEDLLASVSADREELKHVALSLLGVILYRSGRFRAAIDRINEGIAAENGVTRLEEATVLAMAYHEARDRAKAGEILAKVKASQPAVSASNFWDAEAIRLLSREAEQLILDRPLPVDPFGH